jgi:hypothetical protein
MGDAPVPPDGPHLVAGDGRRPRGERRNAWVAGGAATGSPCRGSRAAINRQATAVAAAAVAASMMAVTATRKLGGPRQAHLVWQDSRLPTNLIPNGCAVPPLSLAATRALTHKSHVKAHTLQHAPSTIHALSELPAANGARGPAIRLTAGQP